MAAKDLYEKDFYKVLGVDKKAAADEIKKRYRALARDLHPDKTKGDAAKEEKFKAVSEAYEILSDAKKRAEYDEMKRYGSSSEQGFKAPPGWQPSGGSAAHSASSADFFACCSAASACAWASSWSWPYCTCPSFARFWEQARVQRSCIPRTSRGQ